VLWAGLLFMQFVVLSKPFCVCGAPCLYGTKTRGIGLYGLFSDSEELRMNKSILVSLAILTLSTSVALAAHKTHHSRAMKPNASAAATSPTTPGPAGWPGGGMSNKDREMYVKNLHDSGMDKQKPK
jgi:hypothetical protein